MSDYKITRPIGSGTFGVVSECTDSAGSQFAMKTFKMPENCDVTQDELIRRFKREVSLQRELDSKNIIRIIESKLDVFPPFFVMELASCSLKDLMDLGMLDGDEKKRCLFDVLSGLEVIHARGFKHRDLKPANVLRVDDGDQRRYAISDFGLGAAADGENSTLTGTGVQGGTLMYAAPELARSFRRATPASDIYSFGALLHDFYVGGKRTPYAKQYGPGKIGEIISKCTETLPIRRYRSISTLRADLYDALSAANYETLSRENRHVIDLLNKDQLTSDEWDAVFMRLEEIEENKDFSRELITAFDLHHLKFLGDNHPELLAAYSIHMCEYGIYTAGSLPFDFCDVLADQMDLVISLSTELEQRAVLAYSLLVMGVTHNRWYVERSFANLVKPEADADFVKRIIVESQSRGRDISKDLAHLTYSISLSPGLLHPDLAALVG